MLYNGAKMVEKDRITDEAAKPNTQISPQGLDSGVINHLSEDEPYHQRVRLWRRIRRHQRVFDLTRRNSRSRPH